MNKIQLNAALMVAEMRFGVEPTEQNKAALDAAQKSYDEFKEIPEVEESADSNLKVLIGGAEKGDTNSSSSDNPETDVKPEAPAKVETAKAKATSAAPKEEAKKK